MGIEPAEGNSPAPPAPPPFTIRLGTYLTLAFLLLIWPAASLFMWVMGNTEIDLSRLDAVKFIFLPTIVIQWLTFASVLIAVRHEKAGLASLGYGRFKLSFIPATLLFLVVSNGVLYALELFLKIWGLAIDPQVDIIIKQAGHSLWWWAALSATAAVCEETIFRGYLLTRLRHVGGGEWLLPVALATLSFASGHIYQGLGGFILIFVYGLLFCALYIFTGSLWPGIIAHFLQNFTAVFVSRIFEY